MPNECETKSLRRASRACLHWVLALGSWDRTASAWSIHLRHDGLQRDGSWKWWALSLHSGACQQPASQQDFSLTFPALILLLFSIWGTGADSLPYQRGKSQATFFIHLFRFIQSKSGSHNTAFHEKGFGFSGIVLSFSFWSFPLWTILNSAQILKWSLRF